MQGEGWVVILNRSAEENLIGKLAFVQRFEREVSHGDIWGRDFLVEKIASERLYVKNALDAFEKW